MARHPNGLALGRRVGLGTWLCICLLPFGAGAQPVITQQPVSQTTRLGGTATFNVQAGSTSPLVFQWRKNGVNLPDATGSSLTLNNVGATDGGSYTVAISDGSEAVESDPATLTLEDLPPLSLSDTFAGRTALPALMNLGGTVRGSNADATGEAGEPRHDGKRGGSSVWVAWRSPLLILGGVASVDTAGSGFDTLLAVYRGDTLGNLTRVASDDDRGGYLTSAIRFNVEPNTEYLIAIDGRAGQQGDITLTWRLEVVSSLLNLLPVVTTEPQAVAVASGASALLGVSYTSPTASQVQWFRNGVPLPGATANTLSLQNLAPNQVGEYVAEIRTATRTVISRPADIQISDTDAGGKSTIAVNKLYDSADDGQATAGGSGIQRASRPGPRLRKLAGGPASGYTGTQIFNTFGSTREPGEPNHCGVLGGASEWYSYAAPTNGIVTIDTEGSDFNTVVAVYIVPPSLPITYQNLQSIACDDNNGANGQTSRVLFEATTNDVYYVAVDGVGGARGNVYLNYALRVAPFITRQPASQMVTMGGNASFIVEFGGEPAPTCQWQFNGNNLAGATNMSLNLANVQPAASGLYRAVITNPAGQILSLAATLTVIGPVQDSINRTAAGGTVWLGPGAFFENLVIDKSITIQGAGIDATVVDGSYAGRVIEIKANAAVNLRGLTIRNGYDTATESPIGGGGIRNLGMLTLNEVAVVQNCSESGSGGGILNGGTLTLIRSTLNGNRIVRGEGGGICSLSNTRLSLDGCTVSANKVGRRGNGGGISVLSGASLDLRNTTVSGNRANEGNGGGIANSGLVTATSCTIVSNTAVTSLYSGKGGGIWNLQTVRSRNTLIALNQSIVAGPYTAPAGHDVLGPLVSEGYTLIGDGSDCSIVPYYGDQIGSTGRLIDPRLGPLQNNGGPTCTHALLAGSPAIDRGSSSPPLPVDQRGVPRPKDGDGNGWVSSDIGALEMDESVACQAATQNRLVLGTSLPETGGDGDGQNTGDKPSLGNDVGLPRIIALRVEADQIVRLQILALPGRQYFIQAASDLSAADWQDVIACTTDDGGRGEARLEGESHFPKRFYRVVAK